MKILPASLGNKFQISQVILEFTSYNRVGLHPTVFNMDNSLNVAIVTIVSGHDENYKGRDDKVCFI